MKKEAFNIYKLCTIVLSIVLVVILVIWGRNKLVEKQAEQTFSELASQANSLQDQSGDNGIETEAAEEAGRTEEDGDGETIEIPQKNLDWEKLAATNSDIYAWLYVPGTNIDYPVLQHPTDDSYYLNYNLNGSRGYPGCIYTERQNSKDFTDFDTVVYGHNMRDETMFATLHYFEDETFFVNCPDIYVYIDGKVLVYEIFAAYTGDNTHILNTNDFTTESGRQQYIDEILKNGQGTANLREEAAGLVTTDSRILTLSTCVSGKSENRFLVQAVLVSEVEL